MSAKITTLLTARDNYETIREQIAAILLVESANQQALARAADQEPDDWKLRVFLERSDPWEVFRTQGDKTRPEDTTPVVNIRWEESKADASASNTIERQKVTGTYTLDCYAYGISTGTADGHQPGDERAAVAAQAAARLVRQILMSGQYNYLALRGTVSRRWWNGAKAFSLPLEQRPAQHVEAVRVSLAVDFNELSPQVQPTTLELIAVTVQNESGELTLFEAEYPTPAIP